MDGFQINSWNAFIHPANSQNCLDLRSKQRACAGLVNVQWFDADAVAHQVQRVLAGVIDGDREHAVQARHKAHAFALVQAQQHLGVGLTFELHALGAQFGGEFDVVEDFAVLHHGDLAIVADKGLVAAAQVDDGQAPVANRHAALRLLPDALVVGASVYQLLRHGGQLLRRQRRARTVPVAKDAAHASCSPCRSGEPRFAA